MKKIVFTLGISLILLAGCEPETKTVTNVKFIEEVYTDKGLIYVFEKPNRIKQGYFISSNDEVNLEVGKYYNLKITKESISYNSGFIVEAKMIK
jgi:hypothetical protein